MESEGVDFERRLGTLLPVIEKEVDPENFKDVSDLLGTRTWEEFTKALRCIANVALKCSFLKENQESSAAGTFKNGA